MPQFLAALGAGILGSVGIGLGAMGVSFGLAIAVGASAIGLVTYSALRGSKLRDSGGGVGGPEGHQLLVRSTTEYRKLVYGEAVVSGPLAFMNTAGDSNEQLYVVIALTGHEIDSFQGFYLDDKFIPVADVDTAGDGSVDSDSNSHGYGPIDGTPVLYLRGHLGAAAQTADTMLTGAFTEWTSNHRGRGVAYLVVRMDKIIGAEEVWQAGAPQNISALIRGKSALDPRSATTDYTANPGLCTADYLVDTDVGASFDAARIDYTGLEDTADDCDAAVAIPTASTQPRFVLGGVLSCGDTHRENIEKLLSSMDGQLRYYTGLWRITAGMWPGSSSFTLTEAHLVAPITFRKSPERTERYNAVRGEYFDADRLDKASQYLSVEDASLQSSRDDSLVLWKDLDLPLTTDEYQAQRLAIRKLAQARQTGICVFLTGYNGLDVAPGDRGTVSISELGWSSKTFRCIGLRHVDMVGVEFILKEDDSTAYDDPAEGDYGTRSAANALTFPRPFGLEPHIGDSVIADPFFDRSTVLFDGLGTWVEAQRYFWTGFTTNTTTIALARTGGVYGGVVQINQRSGQFSLTSIIRRSSLFITGEKFRINIRIRKTDNVTTFATAAINIYLGCCDDQMIADNQLNVLAITSANLNGWTVNHWQEYEAEGIPTQNAKTTTQYSHVFVRAISDTFDVDCHFEIDAFNCARIKT